MKSGEAFQHDPLNVSNFEVCTYFPYRSSPVSLDQSKIVLLWIAIVITIVLYLLSTFSEVHSWYAIKFYSFKLRANINPNLQRRIWAMRIKITSLLRTADTCCISFLLNYFVTPWFQHLGLFYTSLVLGRWSPSSLTHAGGDPWLVILLVHDNLASLQKRYINVSTCHTKQAALFWTQSLVFAWRRQVRLG
jgi:hypothetical protein